MCLFSLQKSFSRSPNEPKLPGAELALRNASIVGARLLQQQPCGTISPDRVGHRLGDLASISSQGNSFRWSAPRSVIISAFGMTPSTGSTWINTPNFSTRVTGPNDLAGFCCDFNRLPGFGDLGRHKPMRRLFRSTFSMMRSISSQNLSLFVIQSFVGTDCRNVKEAFNSGEFHKGAETRTHDRSSERGADVILIEKGGPDLPPTLHTECNPNLFSFDPDHLNLDSIPTLSFSLGWFTCS